MSDDLPLFNAGPEQAGPYKVQGLSACGQEQRGDWIVFWADAPRPLHGAQDRGAVMIQLGQDPEHFRLYPPGPITKNGKAWRTWWYAWPNNLTPYSERS